MWEVHCCGPWNWVEIEEDLQKDPFSQKGLLSRVFGRSSRHTEGIVLICEGCSGPVAVYCLDCRNKFVEIERGRFKRKASAEEYRGKAYCKYCKTNHLRGDNVCAQCHYTKTKAKVNEIRKLREQVAELKQKLRKKGKK